MTIRRFQQRRDVADIVGTCSIGHDRIFLLLVPDTTYAYFAYLIASFTSNNALADDKDHEAADFV